MKKGIAFAGTMVLTLAIGVLIGQVSKADSGATPGSADDPVVTKSYVDAKLAGVSTGGSSSSTGSTTPSSSGSDTFKVVQLSGGKVLKGGEGTEIILRSGSATIVASSNGGVSDITAGSDLAGGTNVLANHLLLTPRDDGRGLQLNSYTNYVMVKGPYTVQ